jgi:hypothetical protein
MSHTLNEFRIALADLRNQRKLYLAQNKHFGVEFMPQHVGLQKELQLINEIKKLEENPPTGPAVLMAFADAANSYERRLCLFGIQIESLIKAESKKASRTKLLHAVIVCLLVSANVLLVLRSW